MASIKRKSPTIEEFNCTEKSRQDLEIELKDLTQSKGEKFNIFCGCLGTIAIIYLSLRYGFVFADGLPMALVVLSFTFFLSCLISMLFVNIFVRIFMPSMQLDKERLNLKRKNLEREIEKGLHSRKPWQIGSIII